MLPFLQASLAVLWGCFVWLVLGLYLLVLRTSIWFCSEIISGSDLKNPMEYWRSKLSWPKENQMSSLLDYLSSPQFKARNTPSINYAWGFLDWPQSLDRIKCLGIVGGRSNWVTLTSVLFLSAVLNYYRFLYGVWVGMVASNGLPSLCPKAHFPPHWTFQSELLKDTISVK